MKSLLILQNVRFEDWNLILEAAKGWSVVNAKKCNLHTQKENGSQRVWCIIAGSVW